MAGPLLSPPCLSAPLYLQQAAARGRQDAAHAVLDVALGAALSLQHGCSLWIGTASRLDLSFSSKEKPQVPSLLSELSLPCPLHTSLLSRAAGISTPACCFLF